MLPRIWHFIKAVSHHWGVLVTGGVVIGAVSTWQATGHQVPPWIYSVIAAAALLIAFFRAWNDQVNIADAALSDKANLEWSADRPKISFTQWGQVEPQQLPADHHPAMIFQHGFHLSNDGGVALELKMDEFSVGTYSTNSNVVPRLEAHSNGFVPIWLDGESPGSKWRLDEALSRSVEQEINASRLHYGQAYRVHVRITYRDFSNFGYSSEADLIFHDRFRRIEFSAPVQRKLGHMPPKDRGHGDGV